MRLECQSSDLRTACGIAAGVATTKLSKDILKSLKFEARDELKITASDGELSVALQVEAKASKRGAVLIPTDKITAILRECDGDTVSIDVDSKIADVRCGRSKFKIPTQSADDFPPITEWPDVESIKVSSADFSRIVRRSVYTDDSSKNYALGGIFLQIDDGKLIAATTNRSAMSITKAAFTGAADFAECVAPLKCIKLVGSFSGDEIEIPATTDAIFFRTEGATASCRLIAGRFPDWRRVMPNPAHTVGMVSSILASSIRQAIITSSVESRGVNFQFEPSRVVLSSSATDIGNSEVEIPIQFDGMQIVRLDPTFLLTMCSSLVKGDAIQFGLTDSDSPILVTTEDDFSYVQMPQVMT